VIDGYEYDQLCIDYKVQRLFDYGECDRELRSLQLKLCSKSKGKCNDNDLNGLLESCEQIETITARRLKKSKGKKKDKEYRFCSGQKDGILIDSEDEEFAFKLCLRNVFDDDIDFSNSVSFDTKAKKGKGKKKEKYQCYEDYLQGLPCLNDNKFHSGKYSDNGFNGKYKNENKGGKKKKKKPKGKGQAMTVEFNGDDNDEMNVPIEWIIISAFIMLCLLLCGITYYWYETKKKHSIATRQSMAAVLGRPSSPQHQVADGHSTEMTNKIDGFDIGYVSDEV